LEILHCSGKQRGLWDGFLDNQATSSFYHLFDWKEIAESCLGHKTFYLAALDQGSCTGVLPLVYINSLIFGKILCSMPFLNYGGICASDPRVEAALLKEAKSLVDRNKMAYLELRNIKKLSESLPTSAQKVSMTLKLQPDPDLVWDSFKSKQRTTIRRTYKNDLHTHNGGIEMLDDFYTILAKSWRNLGTPIYKKSFFATILTTFAEKTRIFTVFHKDRPVATAFNGYYKGVIEGMWMGTDTNYKHLQPNYMLYWEMIKHGCENGCRHFHFGRSSIDSGGEFFKKKWNAEAQQLYWQYHLGTKETMPQLNVRNPRYRYAISLWRKLPVELTTLLGPPLARNIP
jgi:FemAB-related protein (PEP-CTERM system-associated)